MAFSFGGTSGTASAPAPSFTFGSNAANTPTPGTSLNNTATTAPSTGFSFGNPAPAPATGASTGFSFGNPAPAPSTGASTGFSFGNPAPAPSSSGGGLFGSNPAPAPSAGGGLFGTSSANPTTNSTSSFFGSANNSSLTTTAATTNAATPNATPGAGQSLTGASQFSTLPPQAQSAVTQIYELVAKHRRTMASVSKMEPKVLSASWLENGNTDHIEEEKKTDGLLVSAGEGLSSSSSLEDEYLPLQCEALRSDFQIVSSKIERSVACAHELRIRAKENSDHGRTEAVWPIEALAARRGVQLTFLNDKGEPLSEKEKLEKKYNELMDKEASLIDRKEVVPSDFMWKLLKTFEEQLRLTQKEVEVLRGQLDMFEASNADIGRGYERQTARNATRDEIASIYNNNQRAMIRIAGEVAFVTEQLGELRSRWRRYHGPNDDPFKKAETQLLIKQNEEDAKLRAIMLSSKANVAANSTGVSTGGSLFGNTTASTQSTGLFGGKSLLMYVFSGAETVDSVNLFYFFKVRRLVLEEDCLETHHLQLQALVYLVVSFPQLCHRIILLMPYSSVNSTRPG